MSRVFRNKKTGDQYVELGEVIDTTNERDGTKCILYRLYDTDNPIFIREASEFHEKFEL